MLGYIPEPEPDGEIKSLSQFVLRQLGQMIDMTNAPQRHLKSFPGMNHEMTYSKAIAVAGIWLGVGLIGLHDTAGWSAVVAIFAAVATAMVMR